MAGITINNTAAGGSVNINLTFVKQYGQVHRVKWATKKIPGRSAAETDTDTFILDPKIYRFKAFVSNTEKATLELLKAEPEYQIKLTDQELSNKNVRVQRVEVLSNDGHASGKNQYPWVATLEFIAEDH